MKLFRKHFFRAIASIAAIGAVIVIGQCTNRLTSSNDGGSSSEVVAVTGTALYADSTPAGQTIVRLRPKDYLASGNNGSAKGIMDVTTDESGTFMIDSVDTGKYCIEIADAHSHGVRRVFATVRDEKLLRLGALVLRPVGTISGTATAPQAESGAIYVSVYGLERRTALDAGGRFSFSDLPEGEYTFHIAPASAEVGKRDSSGIVVASAASQTLSAIELHTFINEDYAGWSNRRDFIINTASLGAAFNETMTGFPLLLRLDASNFDFTPSRSYQPGGDLRFASFSGKHISYEIERWDPVTEHAEVWVKVDTIHAHDSAQGFSVYCGNPSATSWSDGAKVFDTADGFSAVWHFGAGLFDATAWHGGATNAGASACEGISGAGCSFDGAASIIIDPSMALNGANRSLTILLWQKSIGTYSTERMFFEHEIWAAVGNYGFSTINERGLSFDFPSAQSEVRSRDSILSSGAWHMEAVSFNDRIDSATIFHDGVGIKTDTVRSSIGSSSGRSYIGSRGNSERFFIGSMDEVWVLAKPLSPAFIRLLYETQRPDRSLVKPK